MTAIQTLLAGLFDYAGLYPPASLSLRSAANNYLDYARGNHAQALGRFIINADRVEELRSVAGQSLSQLKLSVIISDIADLDRIADEIRNGMPIETLEIKSGDSQVMKEMSARVPHDVHLYIEMPPGPNNSALLQAIADLHMRAKIRMGGVVAEAFPPSPNVARAMAKLAKLRLPFKATAGLHHPIRSCRPFTYEPHSPKGTMHGFINLLCAASVLYFGGQTNDAEMVLLEEDASAWQIGKHELRWRRLEWTRDQLATIRREFLTSIGSCSFVEPIHDLEVLGWL
ncbi:MAG TPA: hypothetical protein VN753_09195 [Terracidiphilus sp.]|nr:hypothetical protein [Terracidiphilus sp.]